MYYDKQKDIKKKLSGSSKKAQNISINVIIVAALALVVLVIISILTTGRLFSFSKSSHDCVNNGGICSDYGCDEGYRQYGNYKCYDSPSSKTPNDQVCCIPIASEGYD